MTDHAQSRQPLPPRDPLLSDNEQGLFQKFFVTRADGSSAPGHKHHDCEYFVLDTTHDKLAPVALEVYADACEATHPQLAQDLRKRYGLAALPAEPRHCPACGYEQDMPAKGVPAVQQRPALVTALQGLLASLSRQPTEFELRAAAHEFTVMADRAAAAARQGGDDA